ncbi:MAG TPA: DNA methyltransferase [Anaerolineaceae bacterium]|nr:DNA methyltransferase [Anaerolineaceae bacterium]HQH85834.1 DNA methyltransferase [Anaerolineaceae bacterium]
MIIEDLELVTIEEAAQAVNKTANNIRDYIQRGRISKYNSRGEVISKAGNGELRVSLKEIRVFLDLINKGEEQHYHAGLHQELGFYGVPEHQRTKHVHRLHPYLGKFIPQLVEWFLKRYFEEDAIILDPFMGSGTTLIQGNEMAMHTIGVDISPFNCAIARVKSARYDLSQVRQEVLEIEHRVKTFSQYLNHSSAVNLSLFPEDRMDQLKDSLLAEIDSDYLRTWFAPKALLEILYYRRLIPHYTYVDLLKVLLSRAMRSSRLITHYDLATPKAPLPVGEQYWCRKHNRFCMPIDNCITKIHQYSQDTVRRLEQFDQIRSDKSITIIQGDSRTIDIETTLKNPPLNGRLIDGIFTSPPYVGQIDYHDQHVYAYELFGFPRQDTLEIGPKKKGKSKAAQHDYAQGIAAVLKNFMPFIKPDGLIFIVANDRFNLYPDIATQSGLLIKETFQRAVTKRTEQGNDPYEETIFMMTKEN